MDSEKLRNYLFNNALIGPREDLRHFKVTQFNQGQSNPTYLVKLEPSNSQNNGVKIVVRTKPPGTLIDSTAHDIRREYKIMKALTKIDFEFPVPKMLAYCSTTDVIGREFFVMEYLEGNVIVDTAMPKVPADKRRNCWFELCKVLARLHQLDISKLVDTLEEGWLKQRPTVWSIQDTYRNFYPRQIRKLASVSLKQASVPSTPQIPHLEEMIRWFTDNTCADATVIMHGDYKLDNVIFSKDYSRILGVIDWELSTLGHPLADLANMMLPFYMSGRFASMTGLRDCLDPDIPKAEELLKFYCLMTGRRYPIEGWNFCLAFSFFRMAVILQGVSARINRGQAASKEAEMFASMMKPSAEYAWSIIQSETRAKL